MFDFSAAEGVIFDCDGTVLDTLGAWDEAERDLFAQMGPITPDQEDRIHSAQFMEACRMFHEDFGVMGSTEEVMAHLDAHLMPFYSREARALPGVVELCRALERAGIPFITLSSSPRRYIEAGLCNVGLLDAFFGIITTEEAGCSKHDAAIYARALEVLGSQKEATWAIDDAPYAIRVMKAFGLNTIAPLNGCSEERTRLLAASADLVVPTLEALL